MSKQCAAAAALAALAALAADGIAANGARPAAPVARAVSMQWGLIKDSVTQLHADVRESSELCDTRSHTHSSRATGSLHAGEVAAACGCRT